MSLLIDATLSPQKSVTIRRISAIRGGFSNSRFSPIRRLKSGLGAFGRLSACADRPKRAENVPEGGHAAERLETRIYSACVCEPNRDLLKLVISASSSAGALFFSRGTLSMAWTLPFHARSCKIRGVVGVIGSGLGLGLGSGSGLNQRPCHLQICIPAM